MATHIPLRKWCSHCMAGQGRYDLHRSGRDDRGADRVPTVVMDYGLLKSKKKDGGEPEDAAGDVHVEEVCRECGPMLVIKDANDDNMFATVVPAKGPARAWIAKRMGKEPSRGWPRTSRARG
eukprot:15785476-Heterocapsa_arctica.AAC.3